MKKYGIMAILSILFLQVEANCISGNCNFGKGKLVFDNGNVYEGSFAQKIPNGKGIMRYSNGNKYLGDWKQGQRDGKGKYIYASGDFYIGEWSKDKKHGEGTFTSYNGHSTEGIWAQGSLQSEVNTDIAIPEVQATSLTPALDVPGKKDRESYQNKEILPNCNNMYCHDGTGKYTYGDGSVYKGTFRKGKPSGEGILNYASGNVYEGQWKNHAPNGEGTMILQNGRKIHGIWREGALAKEMPWKRNNLQERYNATKKFDKETNIYAVVVGIAAYNHMPTLKYTDDDAYRMYAFLKSPEGGALSDNQVKILVDDMATKEEILNAMEEMYLKADENDMVMLYYSGHGLEGSFIPYDFDGKNNRLMHDDIKHVLDKSKAKHKVCYVDACYSGSYANAKTIEAAAVQSFYSKLQNTKSSTAIMMSSKKDEVSLEYMGLRQGIFSHFLMRGMKGEADKNNNSTVTIKELFNFVNLNVKNYTSNTQSPLLAGEFDKNMPVSFVR